jgi:hypothetical protein
LESAVVAADGRLVAAPITLRAGAAVHRALVADADRWTQQVRAIGLDVAGDGLWVERVRFESVAPGVENGIARPGRPVKGARIHRPAETPLVDEDAVAQFVNALRTLRTDDVQLATLGDELADLRRKLPSEADEGEDGLRLADPGTLRRLLDEVESLVVGRLTSPRGDLA